MKHFWAEVGMFEQENWTVQGSSCDHVFALYEL